MINKKFTLIFVFFIFLFGQNVFAQENNENKNSIEAKAELLETHPYENSELASLYIDVLRNAMRKHSNSKGVFIIYCGKVCSYGEVEAHIRGLIVSLNGKGWKPAEFAVLQGGYRETLEVEYWLVPENSCLPIPNSEIDIKDVKFKGTFKRKFVAYDCC
ncbi:hypothetical protein BH20ACI4_BH20ACI4_08720 [soil metagenome]